MKVFAQILLAIFFVILFSVGLISATFKFQLLNYSFWTETFQKHNVYNNLAVISKTSFESQIGKEGGNKDDIKVLTDLITSENAKDIVDHNLQNILNFANGRVSEIIVYLPIDRIPKNLLPKNLAGLKSEMTLTDLLANFNFQDTQRLSLQSLSNLGMSATYVFVGMTSLLLLILILLIFLAEKGKRFVTLGISLILSGSLALLLEDMAINFNSVFSKALMAKTSVVPVLAGIIISPAIVEIMAVWKILGLILFILGVGLFFVKKPR